MKQILPKLTIAIAAIAVSFQVQAAVSVALEPASQSVSTGSPVFVDLVIHGLGNGTAPSLGAFDFDLSYNASLLSAASVAFGSHLDLGIFGSVQSSDLSTPGLIHLDEVSLESASDLNSGQPAQFTIATFGFTAIAPGTSSIDFVLANLSDELGQSLTQFTSQGARVQSIGGVAVPETASNLALLVLGLGSLLLFPRQKSDRVVGAPGE